MANKTWLGGGNNEASNPNDWSPAGVPTFADGMTMTHGTMNIDALSLGANPEFAGVRNNTGLITSGNVMINLSNGAGADVGIDSGHTTINVQGTDNLFVVPLNGGSTTADLAAHSEWVGGFTAITGPLTIRGPGIFDSNASLSVPPVDNGVFNSAQGVQGGSSAFGPDVVTINSDIIGTTPLVAYNGGTLALGGSVSSQVTIPLGADPPTAPNPGILEIDHPKQFLGTVQLALGEIDLNGLARADSYTYQNDLLSIFDGKSVIDTLSLQQIALAQDTPNIAFSVERTAHGVSIYTDANPTHPAGTILPVHV
jgi:hypothetical protein